MLAHYLRIQFNTERTRHPKAVEITLLSLPNFWTYFSIQIVSSHTAQRRNINPIKKERYTRTCDTPNLIKQTPEQSVSIVHARIEELIANIEWALNWAFRTRRVYLLRLNRKLPLSWVKLFRRNMSLCTGDELPCRVPVTPPPRVPKYKSTCLYRYIRLPSPWLAFGSRK